MEDAKLNLFRTQLLEDVTDAILSEENGGISEEKFTEIALEYLEEAGETEGSVLCREIRENSIGKRIHKISGYAIREGYETIDLFITIFKGNKELNRIYADELKATFNLAARFWQNVWADKLRGIEETAPVNDFINTINKIRQNIVRVNIYVLSDMLIPLPPQKTEELSDIKIHYHILDIQYLYRIKISGVGKESVLIDFVQSFSRPLPCLSMLEKNEVYESYLAIIPAPVLADIYEEHGARLLEQNVRTFLQFRGNINKGIRDTILTAPHMFMAYNNGISATAEDVKLSEDGKAIVSVNDFQIVNGGQTTASIFQTRRRYKNADISAVQVQIKLTVIRDQDKKNEIVASISRYANTQNKVSEADLSSNHRFHIEIENLSRQIWAPATTEQAQTRWFYERARGQYNDELYKLDSRSEQNKWLQRNPKSQKFAKEDLARFFMSWDKKPWFVVKGRQKNFSEFMNGIDKLKMSTVLYEDLIAMAILFRTAERLYGTGSNAIGDLRYMVVPYTIAWLSYTTNGRINLSAIWKAQKVSSELEDGLKQILWKVNVYMRDTAPGGLIGEWAKKEECWKKLKHYDLGIDSTLFRPFLYKEEEFAGRYQNKDMSDLERDILVERIGKIGTIKWEQLEEWGKVTGKLNVTALNFIHRAIRKIYAKRKFTDRELLTAEKILKVAEDNNFSGL